jgi:hypothetical protein
MNALFCWKKVPFLRSKDSVQKAISDVIEIRLLRY